MGVRVGVEVVVDEGVGVEVDVDEGVGVVVVLNSFRLFRFGEAYAEQDAAIAQAQAQAPVKREASMRLTPATA